MSGAPSPWGPRWSRWVGRFLARVYWNTEVKGRDNIPATGPVLVLANHIGLIDGPVVHGVIPRPSHFLITARMMDGPLGIFLKPAAQIRVEGAGRTALAQALAVLERGGVVGVFPEGHRGAGTADQTYGGAAWLAVRSGASVVPAAVVGTRNTGESVNIWPRPRRRMLVAFGPAVQLEPPAGLTGRGRQEWAAEQVDQMLVTHLREALAHTDLALPTDEDTADAAPGTTAPAGEEDAHE